MGQRLTTQAAREYPGDASGATGAEQGTTAPTLVDAEGPIPAFPPREFDEHGRLIPLSDEERQARARAVERAWAALDQLPDEDLADSDEAMMRGIDAHRAPGRRLFEGMY